MTEAIALGHDLGHTPFGHAGEDMLNKLLPEGFRHNHHSLRIVEKLEGGKGLNLTREVREGILKHTGDDVPVTLEGQIVRLTDRMAYINHDIDDALRAGILKKEDLPQEEIYFLGNNSSKRINTMVQNMVENSLGREEISISFPLSEVLNNLRDFLFKRVYVGSKAKFEENKAKKAIENLYYYFLENPEELPLNEENSILTEEETSRIIADYIAGMTDRYLIILYNKIFVPKGWTE